MKNRLSGVKCGLLFLVCLKHKILCLPSPELDNHLVRVSLSQSCNGRSRESTLQNYPWPHVYYSPTYILSLSPFFFLFSTPSLLSFSPFFPLPPSHTMYVNCGAESRAQRIQADEAEPWCPRFEDLEEMKFKTGKEVTLQRETPLQYPRLLSDLHVYTHVINTNLT